MTIKAILLSLVTVLMCLVVFVSGQSFFDAKERYGHVVFAEETGPAVEEILSAAGDWAVERGVTNSALAYDGRVPQSMKDIIAKRRAHGDTAYHHALEIIADIEFEGKGDLVSDVANMHSKVVDYRKRVDVDINQRKTERSASLVKDWVPTMSKLILKSQYLRFATAEVFSQGDAALATQSQVKHFAWVMSEYAGRERAVIGGLLSAKQPIDIMKIKTLENFRGRVESAWDSTLKLSRTDHDPDALAALEKAKNVYFGTFEPIRDSVYEAGLKGSPYPITSEEWIAQSTEAIDTLLGIQLGSIEETHHYVDAALSDAFGVLVMSIVVMGVALIIGVISFVTILKKVINPLENMTFAMNAISDGNLTLDVPALGQKDEIGRMAASVQVFKDNAIEKQRLEAKQVENEERAKAEKKQAMQDLADSFDEKVGGLLRSLVSSSGALQSTAESMRSIADVTSQSSGTVASSSEIASENVNTVASAMEEMSASSSEIAAQITTTRDKSNDTANNAQSANETVSNLNELVSNIGEVVVSIKDIAEQTNLLALNATIEAARAGDAGKGFAVVADEVKKLANETAQKTEEIENRIGEIQGATEASVNAMDRIINNISEIDHSVTGVSAAVEEQNATTGEIVRSISEASQGVSQVSQIIVDVQKGAGETGESADSVLTAAKEVAMISDNLSSSVATFLDEIRTS